MQSESAPTARLLRVVGGFLARVPWPLALLLWAGWSAVIFDLSSKRRPVVVHENLWWAWVSNLAHAPLFGLWALLAAALLLRQRGAAFPPWRGGRALAVVLLTGAYGVLDEWHQSRVPGRDASALDVVTDVVAAAMVVWVIEGVARERRLAWRLAAGVGLCCLAALGASLA